MSEDALLFLPKKATRKICSKGIDVDECCRYGHPLAEIDPVHEARIRLKMDFAVVPLVSLIYRTMALTTLPAGV